MKGTKEAKEAKDIKGFVSTPFISLGVYNAAHTAQQRGKAREEVKPTKGKRREYKGIYPNAAPNIFPQVKDCFDNHSYHQSV